mmetsp:Transcript_35557/g.43980  ORF Transcript_35557/g.43980 Transcript_35557/m.43980 type:complete len:343 (-) Transcript_35557:1402-2430(-)
MRYSNASEKDIQDAVGSEFYFIGDSGEATDALAALGVVLHKHVSTGSRPEAVVLLGDNFYPDGVKGIDDPRFRICFEEVFKQPEFHEFPWQVILGNHDHGGDIQSQIDYSGRSSRWKMPAQWYTNRHIIEHLEMQTSSSVLMVYIDTWYFDLKETEDFIRWSKEMKFESKSLELGISKEYYNKREKQLKWLEKTLRTADSDFILVCGHYPVYSDSFHGSSKEMIDTLVPLFLKYGVDAYINGHDHVLQIIEKNGIPYITSGLSTRNPAKFYSKEDDIEFKAQQHGFAAIKIFQDSLQINMVAAHDGKVLHTKIVPKKQRETSNNASVCRKRGTNRITTSAYL